MAETLEPGTATAAAWRIAIALISATRGRPDFYIDKPSLAKMTCVRMDNAERALEPVRGLLLPKGEPVFESITYQPGIRKSLAGQIDVRLSEEAMLMTAGQTIEIDDAEFQLYSHATALTLRMRIGAEYEIRQARRMHFRLDLDIAEKWLGPSIRRAAAQGKSASLARAWHNAIEPAVLQINSVCKDFRISTTIAQQSETPGSLWKSIDLDVERVASRNATQTKRKGTFFKRMSAKADHNANKNEQFYQKIQRPF